MNKEKYSVSQFSISNILGLIESKSIAIPEIQRPFVWKKWQVRNLIDSLYNGYPTGRHFANKQIVSVHWTETL